MTEEMHQSSMKLMTEFIDEHLVQDGRTILDVGAYHVNGNYRALFAKHDYTGGDIEDGTNVDEVFPGEYDFGDKQYDVVISGQCLEHVEDTKEWILAVGRAVKPGGTVCVIAPNTWEEHKHPVDCWRILPDGMRWLFRQAGIDVVEAKMVGADTIGIGIKGTA